MDRHTTGSFNFSPGYLETGFGETHHILRTARNQVALAPMTKSRRSKFCLSHPSNAPRFREGARLAPTFMFSRVSSMHPLRSEAFVRASQQTFREVRGAWSGSCTRAGPGSGGRRGRPGRGAWSASRIRSATGSGGRRGRPGRGAWSGSSTRAGPGSGGRRGRPGRGAWSASSARPGPGSGGR
jgi:hypothetical protein